MCTLDPVARPRARRSRPRNPGFAPDPRQAGGIVAVRKRAATEVDSTLDLLRERVPQLAADTQARAQALLAGRENLQWLIATAPIESHAGIKTRYHGDYHLGQVLLSGSDSVIIDFEVKPARSLDERL